MKRLIDFVLDARERSRVAYWSAVRSPLGNWIPAPNVLGGLVAAGLVSAAHALGVIDVLPVGWSEAVAGAFVTYWIGPPREVVKITLTPPTVEDVDVN